MTNSLEQIRFTTRVLGPAAAYRLEKRQVTQTLRSDSNPITESIISGRVSTDDRLEVFLDRILVGKVEFVSIDAVIWEALGVDDAHRGGFDTLADLEQALKRAGYRFKPLNQYQLYRIQFSWLEEVYA
ncbi:unnamed protein product [marine sediment metagenome]|uniref:ASCH domain-containing protein n=1 Tax=marine sediment metagenome TaxID=412755 RepID=X1V1Z2_9ZZZZ